MRSLRTPPWRSLGCCRGEVMERAVGHPRRPRAASPRGKHHKRANGCGSRPRPPDESRCGLQTLEPPVWPTTHRRLSPYAGIAQRPRSGRAARVGFHAALAQRRPRACYAAMRLVCYNSRRRHAGIDDQPFATFQDHLREQSLQPERGRTMAVTASTHNKWKSVYFYS